MSLSSLDTRQPPTSPLLRAPAAHHDLAADPGASPPGEDDIPRLEWLRSGGEPLFPFGGGTATATPFGPSICVCITRARPQSTPLSICSCCMFLFLLVIIDWISSHRRRYYRTLLLPYQIWRAFVQSNMAKQTTPVSSLSLPPLASPNTAPRPVPCDRRPDLLGRCLVPADGLEAVLDVGSTSASSLGHLRGLSPSLCLVGASGCGTVATTSFNLRWCRFH